MVPVEASPGEIYTPSKGPHLITFKKGGSIDPDTSKPMVSYLEKEDWAGHKEPGLFKFGAASSSKDSQSGASASGGITSAAEGAASGGITPAAAPEQKELAMAGLTENDFESLVENVQLPTIFSASVWQVASRAMTAEKMPEDLQGKVQEKLQQECAKFLSELEEARSRKFFPSVKPGTKHAPEAPAEAEAEADPKAPAEVEAAMSEPRSLTPTPTEMSAEAASQAGEAAPSGETLPAPVPLEEDQDMQEVPPPKIPECNLVDLEPEDD